MISYNKVLLLTALMFEVGTMVVQAMAYFGNITINFDPVLYMYGGLSALLIVFIITNVHKYIKF